MKKVTPEMIDDELARTIWKGVATPIGTPCNIDLIRATLAYLANNPIEPTEEQSDHLRDYWMHSRKETNYSSIISIEFQRIAYLKKEQELPEEIKALKDKWYKYALGAEAFADIVAAYKIGAKLK